MQAEASGKVIWLLTALLALDSCVPCVSMKSLVITRLMVKGLITESWGRVGQGGGRGVGGNVHPEWEGLRRTVSLDHARRYVPGQPRP